MIGGIDEENCVLFLGCVCFAFGGIGAVLPILTTVPFLLLAAFCFARSSERLHAWFQETKLYKENLEDYVAGNGMRKQAKIRIMCTVTVLMSIGFILMSSKGVYIGCIVLACVWILHILYFCFKVKTIAE